MLIFFLFRFLIVPTYKNLHKPYSLKLQNYIDLMAKKMFDVLAIVPCTSNTLAKLSLGITDTCVTMATKSHLRNNRPVVIGVSTNDALGASGKNIGTLLNCKNYYFVPFGMDNPDKKPKSMVCDFSKVKETIELAFKEEEIAKKIY